MKKMSLQKGLSIIELLIAIGLTSLILPVLVTGFFIVRSNSLHQNQRLQATSYLREAVEVTRIVRDNSWESISVNGIYHPVATTSSWMLSSGNEIINPYNLIRQIEINDTYRDSSGLIVESGGTLDPSTKKITVTVSWNTPILSSVISTFYLTRYHDNASLIQSTVSDFSAGTATNTIITNTNGGEVTLGAGGGSSWCDPNLSITALDLPKNGVANAVSAIEGGAFAGTGDNASGVSFANITITNTKPPIATIVGTFDGFKTNGVFGETNYAYLATDTGSKEIEIIDLTQLTNGKYSEAGYFNAPGNGRGNSVYVSGNVGYMTAGNRLYTFDLSSKSGSRPQLGTVALAGTGSKIYVIGNYVYVAIAEAALELQIIQVTNGGSTLTVVGQADVNGQASNDVFINSSATRAYLATGVSSSQRELFIIDTSVKTGNRPTLGSYDSNGMNPKGITVVPGNKAVLVGTSGEEYQVIDITNEANPVRCGGLQINTGVNGVSGIIEQDGDAYSYIITGDASTEFKIIEGGPGGQYSSSGTFTSAAFDAGSTVTYNRLIPTFSQPSQTNIQFQIAVADAISGSCTNANYYFIGPDGTSNTYFTSAGPIPLVNNGQGYVNPGRCIKYKAYLSTSDISQAPVLYDVSFNYSP